MEPVQKLQSADPAGIDQRVYLHGVPWEEYEALLRRRGESSVPRMTYWRGELELMTPAWNHEEWKKRFARLIEAWFEESGVDVIGVGSWTIKDRLKEVGLEPDECYVLWPEPTQPRVEGTDAPVDRPDVAIEVVWTSGGLSKLDLYRELGVQEVWFWESGALSMHALRGDHYEAITRSELVPAFEPDTLVAYMLSDDNQTRAVRAYRAELRQR